jgi:hypothetical protein
MKHLVTTITLASLVSVFYATGTGFAQEEGASEGSMIGRGFAASAAGDREGAISAFREAVALAPSRPAAVCYLAEAQRVSGDHESALEGYRACVRIARAANDPRWIARGLHGVASTLESMTTRLLEARVAWQEYVMFADGAAAHASSMLGRARITAIDQVIELERVMIDVRARISERESRTN